MRIFGLGLVTLFTLLGSAPAGASDADVLRQFGMLGTIALDCSKPYSESNPHVTFAVSPQGQVTRTLRSSENLNATLTVRSVRMAGPDLMEFEETGRQSELRTTVAKIEGKFRSWRSVRTSGPDSGAVLIADGKSASSGTPTRAFTFCRAN